MSIEENPVASLSGRVVKTHSGFFTVETSAGLVTCQIAGRLTQSEELTNDLVALGDFVELEKQSDGTGTIIQVMERKHTLSRVAPSSAVATSAEREQILITHCDQAIFVYAAAQPRPQPRMLDRLLVAAEKAEIPSIIICVNKVDLVEPAQLKELFQLYEDIGYKLLYLSAKQDQGIETLRELLHDKVSVFTGPSGVGKSSLLNCIKPGLKLHTSEVSEAIQKGRHTTRFSQLIKLDEDHTYLADTPGIRSMAPWDVEPDELDSYFIEMRPFVETCRFTDCSHLHEPGCAVISAVQKGDIHPSRYESYVRLREELEEQYVYL